MQVLALIQLCAREYNDIGYERVARDSTTATTTNMPSWLDWLNDALRVLILVKPDASAFTESFKLGVGTKQKLASDTQMILDVVRNMGADGNTPGRTIRLVDRDSKESNRDWHTQADTGGPVKEVIYDDKKDPLTFYVSPPAANKYIELTLCKAFAVLADATVATDALPTADVYSGPLQAWMLHRAFALASQSPANFNRAWNYFQSFFQQLNLKQRAELFAAAAASGERS